eukprot:scaffold2200_cov413-Prasinococcus_capsulatus_cf.AAC.4
MSSTTTCPATIGTVTRIVQDRIPVLGRQRVQSPQWQGICWQSWPSSARQHNPHQCRRSSSLGWMRTCSVGCRSLYMPEVIPTPQNGNCCSHSVRLLCRAHGRGSSLLVITQVMSPYCARSVATDAAELTWRPILP